jgi:predicted nucleic acid-binding protein
MGSPVRPAPKVYIDSNVFITAFETKGARSDHAWWLLDAIDEGEIAAATSELTLAELLVRPLELGSDELVGAYRAIMASAGVFTVRAVDTEILIEAARTRARRRALKLPDAIHVATAAAVGCTFFISGDRRLDMPDGVAQLPLSPFCLDDILKDSR